MKKINICILGLGRIGFLHASNVLRYFHDRVNIKYIVDNFISEEKKKWVAANNIELISDPGIAFQDPEIEAVLIVSPTDTHAKYIIEAANHKKHIFCEKPIDLEPEVVKKALAATKKNKVHLLIGFNRRFDRNFLKLKKLLEKHSSLRLIKITSRDPAPAGIDYLKTSGGIFIDMAIHDFDMLNFIYPEEIAEVTAHGSCLIVPELKKYQDVDLAITYVKFKNGVQAIIDNSREASYGYDQRVEVLTSKGMVCAQNEISSSVVEYGSKSVQHDVPPWFFLERYQDSFIKELDFFFSTIKKTSPGKKNQKLLSGENGMTALLIALAATKSLKEKKTVRLK